MRRISEKASARGQYFSDFLIAILVPGVLTVRVQIYDQSVERGGCGQLDSNQHGGSPIPSGGIASTFHHAQHKTIWSFSRSKKGLKSPVVRSLCRLRTARNRWSRALQRHTNWPRPLPDLVVWHRRACWGGLCRCLGPPSTTSRQDTFG